jgi:GNAT superfamily N-acetyltransferase
VGYFWIEPEQPGKEAWITDFFISAPFRGHGLGQGLLAELVRRAAGMGATSVGGVVSDHNRAMLTLLTRSGFEPVHNYTRHGLPRTVFRRSLLPVLNLETRQKG